MTDSIKRVGILAGGTGLAVAVNLLAMPIMTRLYSPQSMGEYGICLTFISVLGLVASLRYESLILLARDGEDAMDRLSLALLLVPAVSLGAAVVLLLLAAKGWAGYGIVRPMSIILTAGAIFAYGGFTAFRYYFIWTQDFMVVSRVTLTQYIVRSILQVALFPFQSLGMLMGECLGRIFGLPEFWRKCGLGLAGIRSRRPRLVRSFIEQFPQMSIATLGTLAENLAVIIPLNLVLTCYGAEFAGYFSLVSRVLSVPLILVGGAIADVFHEKLGKLLDKDGAVDAGRVLDMTTLALVAIGILPAILFMTAGPRVFAVVFSPAWYRAGSMAGAFVLASLSQLVISTVSRIAFVAKGQGFKLTSMILSLACALIAFMVVAHRGGSIEQALRAYSYSILATSSISWFGYRRMLIRQS